jgi:hypothetical protein
LQYCLNKGNSLLKFGFFLFFVINFIQFREVSCCYFVFW